jgi:hypothetical protein
LSDMPGDYTDTPAPRVAVPPEGRTDPSRKKASRHNDLWAAFGGQDRTRIGSIRLHNGLGTNLTIAPKKLKVRLGLRLKDLHPNVQVPVLRPGYAR